MVFFVRLVVLISLFIVVFFSLRMWLMSVKEVVVVLSMLDGLCLFMEGNLWFGFKDVFLL